HLQLAGSRFICLLLQRGRGRGRVNSQEDAVVPEFNSSIIFSPRMTKTIVPKRIMAVDPGMQYLGIAVLEGEELIWYGIKTFPGRKILPYMRTEVQQYLTKLLQTYEPQVLVVEDPFYAQSLLSKNLRTLTQDIKTWGRWKGVRVCSYLPTAVKAFFCRDRKNKQSLAEALI